MNEFDQGLRFVHNPTKSTKRRPPQNRLEITSKWLERACTIIKLVRTVVGVVML